METSLITMSQTEAREKTERIKASLTDARCLLLEIYERGGWAVLGYSSWREYGQAEFGYSESRIYQLMDAAKTERNISTMVEMPQPQSERQLRPLSHLEPEQQQEAWAQVVEENPDGHITGAKVQAVVNQFQVTKEELDEIDQEEEQYCSNCKHHSSGSGADDGWCNDCHRIVPWDAPDPWCDLDDWEPEEEQEPEPKPHVTHNSGNNEWYTPAEYIEAARRVMGTIDLDPASSDKANETVKAATYYTAEIDGLVQEWAGRVWMNPPYASALIGPFCEKLIAHIQAGDVPEVCILVNNATETGWFQSLLGSTACLCLLKGRVKFIDMDGKPSGAPLQGQVILYAGPNDTGFAQEFGQFGAIFHAW